MLTEANVIAFAATKDPVIAKQFYEQTLGLTLVADEPYALVFDANGTMLRLQKVQAFQPLPFTSLGWDVSDIKATISQLASHGVQFERYPGIPQDEQGIALFDDVVKVAWFKDPDGNLLSLTQF